MPEHVPTVAELAREHLAQPVAFNTKGDPTHWRLTQEGQQRVYAAMSRNAHQARHRAAQRAQRA